MNFLGLPADASPRLKAVQIAQISIIFLTMIATFLTAVIPQEHKAFTFGLLYTLIFTSFTTTIILRKEQQAALKGELTKSKYVKYQVIKLASAFGLSIVGFIAFIASTPQEGGKHRAGEQGLWIGGVKVNRYQGWILWLNFFNWVFLWGSLCYSCCMTGRQQGAIALTGDEEAHVGTDNVSDEEYARRLQAEDPNWQR
ncbi:hypothetical protein DE146DRAFT_604301 [Phaeosphaeria sp. MPI-PUGE-AT-0046c]|nr:hypothetical protein DE146DRAFT_604301 [Phaeosphaeria sp. MPI-PUGE-AT-0046c]